MKKIILLFSVWGLFLSCQEQPLSLEQKARRGNAEAQYQLGQMYHIGDKMQQSHTKAVEWWEKAAKKGLAKAQLSLGNAYMEGEGVEQSEKTAIEWWKKAAEKGLAEAQYKLGFAHSAGMGVEQSHKKAVEWWKKSAEKGFAKAQFSLGNAYLDGVGVEQSDEKAVFWWEKAFAQGNADAQQNLDYYYEQRNNTTKAFEWFKKAAKQGNAKAQFNLGLMYEAGKGVEQSKRKSLYWYNKATQQNHIQAKTHLGTILYYDEFLDKDKVHYEGITDGEMAFDLLQEPAQNGDKEAQYLLGMLNKIGFFAKNTNIKHYVNYLDENGNLEFPKNINDEGLSPGRVYDNPEDAIKFFKAAAEQGHPKAQHELGIIYYEGGLVTQMHGDYEIEKFYSQAIEWLQKACDNGVTEACEKLNEINKQL